MRDDRLLRFVLRLSAVMFWLNLAGLVIVLVLIFAWT
jgi:hypothetical protein